MKRKVAIYARVSTEHEAQLNALENQIQHYNNILAQHPEWELVGRYVDEGITGTSVKKRKNFLRMMEEAKNGMFSLILTREVSRFARNTVDTLQETRKLKSYGVEVYFTEDNIRTFDDMLSNQLKDEDFRKEYEAIQPEMDVIRAIVDARTSQNLMQKELAECTGINQADISKLENGTRNPSVNLLKRLADGMGMALKIEFIPKQKM